MPSTVALVRWANGWAERESAGGVSQYGRSEALLGLGALGSLAEVYRVADAQLGEFAFDRLEAIAGFVPINDAEQPYIAFRPGDIVTHPTQDLSPTTSRLMSITVGEDEDGNAILVPTLNAVIIDEKTRVFQALKKMANGTIGGRSKVAQPVLPIAIPRGFVSSIDFQCIADHFTDADSAPIGPELTWTTAVGGTGGTADIRSNHVRVPRSASVARNVDYSVTTVARAQDIVGSAITPVEMEVTARIVEVPTNSTGRRVILGSYGIGACIDPAATNAWFQGVPFSALSTLGGVEFNVGQIFNNPPASDGGDLGEVHLVINGVDYASPNYLYSDNPAITTLGMPHLAAGDQMRLRVVRSGGNAVVTAYLNDILVASATVLSSVVGNLQYAGFQIAGTSYGFLGAPTPAAPSWNGEIGMDTFAACLI